MYFREDLNETLEPSDLTLASTIFCTFIHGAAPIIWYRLCGSRRPSHLKLDSRKTQEAMPLLVYKGQNYSQSYTLVNDPSLP